MPRLVLSVIGDDRAGLVEALAEAIGTHGGNWERSQMAELAGQFAGIVVVSVPDDRADELRSALARLDWLLDITAHPGIDEAAGAAPDGWAELRIDPGAVPLREQEIASRQEEIDRKLDELIRELKADARSIDRLKSETRAKDELNLQEEVRLRGMRDRAAENAAKLEQLAQDAALSPELAEYKLFAPADLRCWPAGTGYALADWLRSRGHVPQFIEWPPRS